MTLQFVMTSNPTSHDGVSSSESTDSLPKEVFEVEKIVGKVVEDDGKVQYEVQWKGYPKLVS